MAEMTNADKKAFIASVSSTLKANTDAFAGKDFDPVARAAALDVASKNIDDKVQLRVAAETAYNTALADEQTARMDGYTLANAAVNGVSGALTEQHPLTQKLRKMRGSMHHSAPTPAPATDTPSK